ncbi:angiopoietin-4-like isoform X1 [Drosophila ananassae]|uniref:angiopoietin-4-like isoform X1 n=1 Tax=Drosophila ananassae TaxID=7217 RepID=UPI0013A5DDC0|nr:angiopoietin-4-like isoform X1 [Drosophila ananassae]
MSKTKTEAQTEALTDRCRPTSNGAFEVQDIQIPNTESFKVVCRSSKILASDLMMVYRKPFNSKEFNRTLEQYTSGFGNVSTIQTRGFFIGLERLHLLTNKNPHELIIFVYPSGKLKEIRCDNFVLGSKSEGYIVKTLSECSADSSILSQGLKFATFDLNDENSHRNKAHKWGFGWWIDSGCVL